MAADEQDDAFPVRNVRDEIECLLHQILRLLQVYDIDTEAVAENVWEHVRVSRAHFVTQVHSVVEEISLLDKRFDVEVIIVLQRVDDGRLRWC